MQDNYPIFERAKTKQIALLEETNNNNSRITAH